MKVKNETVQEQSYYMLSNQNWHKFKLDCYKFRIFILTPMVTSKKISGKHTPQEMKRESKWYTTNNQLSTNKARNKIAIRRIESKYAKIFTDKYTQ